MTRLDKGGGRRRSIVGLYTDRVDSNERGFQSSLPRPSVATKLKVGEVGGNAESIKRVIGPLAVAVGEGRGRGAIAWSEEEHGPANPCTGAVGRASPSSEAGPNNVG